MRWTPWCSAVIAVSLSGCFGFKTGQKFDDSSVKNIRTGKTTRAEVMQMFGQPPTRNSTGGGSETWMYQYNEIQSHATAATYIPIVNIFAGGAKSTSNQQTLTVQFLGDVVSACTYGKSSSDTSVSTSLLGASAAPGQTNSVTTPCEEAL